MSFDSNVYPGFKLHHIGNWEWQWWGMRWSLNHEEVEEVIKEITAEKNYMSTNCREINTVIDGTKQAMKEAISQGQNAKNVSFLSEAMTGFLGLVSNLSQTNESSYDYLNNKIQSSDLGKGVIVDLNGKYSNQLGNALVILNSGKIYSR